MSTDHRDPAVAHGSREPGLRAAGGAKGGVRRALPLVAGAGLAGGVLTSYAQGWLPYAIGPLANSSGPWALVAFGLALLGRDRRAAALYGSAALGTLLAGYVIASEIRSYTASHALIVFWGAAALALGPLLGLAASLARTERGVLAAVGVGTLSGILAGEGIYGLSSIADTTYPRYWWCEIALGALVLVAGASLRRWSARVIIEAVVVSVVAATLFVAIYRQDLISVLH